MQRVILSGLLVVGLISMQLKPSGQAPSETSNAYATQHDRQLRALAG